MNSLDVEALKQADNGGFSIGADTALAVLQCDGEDMPAVMEAASRLRKRFFGNQVHLCSIVNAKSGACGEDCAFCAQSGIHQADSEIFPLLSESEIVSAYDDSGDLPIGHFGVVTSGGTLSESELERIAAVIRDKQREKTYWCASLGCLSRDQLLKLREAGLKRFHHNLETAASFFPSICSTHAYEERLETARAAKDIGMELCCGGILGMGESFEQRVEFALTLREEQVDAIPLNFLIPLEGTALGNTEPMQPMDILRSIAMFRLVNPTAELKVCAGRLLLRDMQAMIFYAGATGMMIGDLLTVAGRKVEDDLQMLRDLEVPYEW